MMEVWMWETKLFNAAEWWTFLRCGRTSRAVAGRELQIRSIININ